MGTWWSGLSAVEHVYWLIAICASTVLAIQLILACVSGLEFHMGDGTAVEHGQDVGSNFQLLTVRNIVAFFTLFGWTGLAFNHQHLPLILTLILSFLCGLAMMLLMAFIFLALSKLQSSGTIDINQTVGKTANVYIPIPPTNTGSGAVTLVIQGRQMELEAVTADKEKIVTGTLVKVKEIINNKILVERV